MTRIKEKEWFENHPQYNDILHVCGIDRLMDTMISLLADKMVTEVPNLVREMKNLKEEVNKLCTICFVFCLFVCCCCFFLLVFFLSNIAHKKAVYC